MNRKILLAVALIVFFALGRQASSQVPVQVGYGILVDNSLSQLNTLNNEIELAKLIAESSEKEVRLSVFAFATNPATKRAEIAKGVQCTIDHVAVDNQLQALFAVSGQTTLVDAISTAAELLGDNRPQTCPAYSQKRLFIITDGEDRASTTKAADLYSSLKAAGVKVYVIGLITGLSDERGFLPKSARQKAREFLDQLAKDTGGAIIYPKSNQVAADVVKQLLEPKTNK